MSDYVREKVLRIPFEYVDLSYIKSVIAKKYDDSEEDITLYIEHAFPDLFGYSVIGKFQIAPIAKPFFDYVLDREYGAEGEYGKTRALTDKEKKKYFPIFQKIIPNINMDYVRLVEFCWYNCCEAPDYYDEINDPFYDEV